MRRSPRLMPSHPAFHHTRHKIVHCLAELVTRSAFAWAFKCSLSSFVVSNWLPLRQFVTKLINCQPRGLDGAVWIICCWFFHALHDCRSPRVSHEMQIIALMSNMTQWITLLSHELSQCCSRNLIKKKKESGVWKLDLELTRFSWRSKPVLERCNKANNLSCNCNRNLLHYFSNLKHF